MGIIETIKMQERREGEAKGRYEGEAKGRYEGEARGEVKGSYKKALEIAREMKKDKFTIEQIAKLTKLSIKEIEAL